MKLRNKKTGEIKSFGYLLVETDSLFSSSKVYNSLGELFKALDGLREDWEDYKPDEPLIKDKRTRKAVRAWAEACGAKQIKYSIAPNQYYDADMGTGFSIKFLTKPVEVYLEEGKIYTIAELCGEEE